MLYPCVACVTNCSAITDDEMKCMKNASTKNEDDIGNHCTGVDFDTLEKGGVSVDPYCGNTRQ